MRRGGIWGVPGEGGNLSQSPSYVKCDRFPTHGHGKVANREQCATELQNAEYNSALPAPAPSRLLSGGPSKRWGSGDGADQRLTGAHGAPYPDAVGLRTNSNHPCAAR